VNNKRLSLVQQNKLLTTLQEHTDMQVHLDFEQRFAHTELKKAHTLLVGTAAFF
jgi:hypothetical protein